MSMNERRCVASQEHLGSRTKRSICMSAPTTKAVSRGFASACTTMSSSSCSCSCSGSRSCSSVCCGPSAAGAAGRSLGVSFDIAFSNELLARSLAPISSSRTFSAREGASFGLRQRNGSLEVGACADDNPEHPQSTAHVFPFASTRIQQISAFLA